MQRFDEKLCALRKRHNLTMRELADKFGLSTHGYIGDLESNRRQSSLELAVQIADFFGMSVDELARDDVELNQA